MFFFLERKTVKVRGSVLHVFLVFICKLIYNLCTCTIIKNNYNFTHIWVQIIPGVRIRHFLITFKTYLITFILENRFSLSLSNDLGLYLSNRRPLLSLKSDSASLPFPQILYVRDLSLSMFLCFDLR